MPKLRTYLPQIKDYPAFLEEHWQKHLEPKTDNAPTVISLFAGCGGSTLGYSMAGYKELLAVEWDNNAVDTFKLNFPEIPVYRGDIKNLSAEEILQITGLKVGELDVLDGSPPCQGFSMAGKRVIDDPRNFLFREYSRILRGLQPKVFIMENVSGMVKGKMKLVFSEILQELKSCGYKVEARVLNAMYFGVPQSRQRIIFIGVRDDLNIAPSHPLPHYKTVSILQSIGPIESNTFDSGGQYAKRTLSQEGTMMTITKENGHHLSVTMPPFDDRYAKLWDQIPKSGGSAYGVIGQGYNNCYIPDCNKPSPTLPKTQTGRGFATIARWEEKRALTIEEAKRFGSFPDPFQFIGAYSIQWMRIGNSVPPLFMYHIANHVKVEILEKT